MLEMKDLTKPTDPRYILAILLLIMLAGTVTLGGCSSKSSTNLSGAGRSASQTANDSAAATKAELGSTTFNDADSDRKAIENADLNLKVQDVAAAVDQIMALTGQNGGYTVSSRINRDNEQASGRLSIKVPQDNLLSTISSIGNLGEITDKTITNQDVTEEYYDSQARLKVLQAKEQRLIALMDEAANITDVISIENELTKTRSDIEVLTGRVNYLTNATTYSLINITLTQGLPGTIQAPQGTLGKSWHGFIASISGVISFASGLVVFIFTALPWLIVLAAVFLLGRWGCRKIRWRKGQG
jgi:hypothetical protein